MEYRLKSLAITPLAIIGDQLGIAVGIPIYKRKLPYWSKKDSDAICL